MLCNGDHRQIPLWSRKALQHGPMTREQWLGVEMGVGVQSVVGEGARVRVGEGEGV